MTPQVEDGLELAQALDSLIDALGRASRHAQQEDSACQLEPVELTLQVTLSRTGPGTDGIKWRVLGADREALPHAGSVHSLKMRFTPRRARLDFMPEASGRGTHQPESRSTTDPASPSPLSPTSVLGPRSYPPVAASARRWTRADPGILGRGAGTVATADGTYAVRVSCYLESGPGGMPPLLVIERLATVVPEVPAGIRRMNDAASTPADKERLVDATAEYVASRVDGVVFKPVRQQWEVRGLFNPAVASDELDSFQEWLRNLAQSPLMGAATALRVPSPVGEVASGIGANIVIAPVDRSVQGATEVIDVVGIVVGSALGMHPLVIACLKHLARTEFHRAVAGVVTKAFDGLSMGSKDVPPAPSPSRPAPPPSPDAPAAANPPPGPQMPTRRGLRQPLRPPGAPRPSTPPPSRPWRPPVSPPPAPPPRSSPPPSVPHPKPKGPGAPGIRGPGGFGV